MFQIGSPPNTHFGFKIIKLKNMCHKKNGMQQTLKEGKIIKYLYTTHMWPINVIPLNRVLVFLRKLIKIDFFYIQQKFVTHTKKILAHNGKKRRRKLLGKKKAHDYKNYAH